MRIHKQPERRTMPMGKPTAPGPVAACRRRKTPANAGRLRRWGAGRRLVPAMDRERGWIGNGDERIGAWLGVGREGGFFEDLDEVGDVVGHGGEHFLAPCWGGLGGGVGADPAVAAIIGNFPGDGDGAAFEGYIIETDGGEGVADVVF